MCEIKRALMVGLIIAPHIQYLKEKVETHILEIRQSPSTLYMLNSPLDGNASADESSPRQAASTTTPVPENGRFSFLFSYPRQNPLLDYYSAACSRLIGRAFTFHELPSLIEAILSNEDERETALCLPLDDAQTFIDVIDEVRPMFHKTIVRNQCPYFFDQALHSPNLLLLDRKRFIKLLYRTCSHYAFLPRALDIPVSCDQNGAALYRGGYADVWKGKHCGQDAAVKVIRTYSNCELQKVISVSLCLGYVSHVLKCFL